MKKMILPAVVLFFLFGTLTTSATAGKKWKPFNSWSFKGGWSAVFGAAKQLPKHTPLLLQKADTKTKEISFKADWNTLDIPKTELLRFIPEGKDSTLVEISGVSDWYAYKTLEALGTILKQPIPAPPKDRKHSP